MAVRKYESSFFNQFTATKGRTKSFNIFVLCLFAVIVSFTIVRLIEMAMHVS